VPDIFVQFGLPGWIFIKVPYKNFTEICPVGTVLRYVNEQLYMMKVIGAFHEYMVIPKE
jgi:hypothetical protein